MQVTRETQTQTTVVVTKVIIELSAAEATRTRAAVNNSNVLADDGVTRLDALIDAALVV